MLDVKRCAKQVEQNLSYLTSSPTLMSCTNMVPGAALMSCVIKKNFQPLHLYHHLCCFDLVLSISNYIIFVVHQLIKCLVQVSSRAYCHRLRAEDCGHMWHRMLPVI